MYDSWQLSAFANGDLWIAPRDMQLAVAQARISASDGSRRQATLEQIRRGEQSEFQTAEHVQARKGRAAREGKMKSFLYVTSAVLACATSNAALAVIMPVHWAIICGALAAASLGTIIRVGR